MGIVLFERWTSNIFIVVVYIIELMITFFHKNRFMLSLMFGIEVRLDKTLNSRHLILKTSESY